MPHIMRNDLTAEDLRCQVSYDAETGIFVRRYVEGWNSKNVWAGRVAGTPNGDGYLIFSVNKTLYKAHRLAWLYHYGEWPKHTIDHINGDRSDNCISNLRDIPQSLNLLNMRRHREGRTPRPKAVKGSTKWVAKLRGNYLGTYSSYDLAEGAIIEWLANRPAPHQQEPKNQ